MIEECSPLSEMAEAFRYFAEVHAKGEVVIAVEPNSSGIPELELTK